MTTPRERALEHTVMALCDVLLLAPSVEGDVRQLLASLRRRMNADTEPGLLAAHARQLSVAAQMARGDDEIVAPDEFCGEQQG